MASLSQWLSQYKVVDLPIPQSLVTLRTPQQTLFDAIQALSEHHVLSAPVVNAEGELIGMLDTLDIVSYVVHAAEEGKARLEDSAIDVLSSPVAATAPDALLKDIGDSVAGPRPPSSRLDGARLLDEGRRAVVVGDDGVPISVITQSTLVQFIHSKWDEIDALHSAVAHEYCSPGVLVVSEEATALQAFETISKKDVSSLVVVDKAGVMQTVISATDLVVGLSHMADKSAAIDVLRSTSVKDYVMSHRTPNIRASLTVSPTCPLEDVLKKLALTRVHRVVVTNEDRSPVGVLSLSNIIRAIVKSA